jgi:16S rRNA processing protein RimM
VALVRIGEVARAIGLSGEVGVAGSDGALATLGEVMLRRRGEEGRRYRVEGARRQGRLWVVKLRGVADREGAEALRRSEVLAERAELGEAGEGRYLWVDLEGRKVVTSKGEAVGVVTDLLETGGVDVLVVKGDRGEVLVPLAPYVTVEVAGRIVVDPPEGLLDLPQPGTGKGGPGRGD